jgi:hypothetical protein
MVAYTSCVFLQEIKLFRKKILQKIFLVLSISICYPGGFTAISQGMVIRVKYQHVSPGKIMPFDFTIFKYILVNNIKENFLIVFSNL